ncbi:MAG: murein biosynthesis integral membrane protein MurJ [Nocardioidaceae bacterium]
MTQTSSPSVLSASTIMAAGTVVSRATGFVRSALLAAAIGLTTSHADVFNVANTIPNSLYILVAGGVFNAVLVPQLVRAIKRDADGGDAYANRIITLGALVLAGVSAVLVIIAPWFLRLIVDGSYFTDPSLAAQQESLIDFARWCLPQIFFYGMFVLIGQILNARGRFGPMMWTPIANNIVSAAILVTYLFLYSSQDHLGGFSTDQELLLGLGSTVGIALQCLILLPFLRATGFRIRPRHDFRHTGLSHTLRLGMWTVGFVIANQIAYYVMVHRATLGTAGGASGGTGYTVYANAFLLTQVPHSIVTVSLATATIPLVSRMAADGRLHDVGVEMSRTLRMVLVVIVPFAISLLVLGPVVATIMFSWGAAAGDTSGLGLTLIAFAPGLLMFSVHYCVLRGFYAIEDTRTPFFIQCAIAAVNIVLAITLTMVVSPRYVAPVLALAYGAAYTVGAFLSASLLAHKLGTFERHELVRFIVRVTVAAVPAAGCAWLCLQALEQAGLDVASKADSVLLLLAGGALGCVIYLLLARLLHIGEVTRIVGLLTSRARR